MLETHWIHACNCKDKIMNKEATTIAKLILVWRSSQNFCRCLLYVRIYNYNYIYSIEGTFGKEFNLANWQIMKKLPN